MASTLDVKQVHRDYWVCGQIDPGDMVRAAEMGIKTVINCRPDNEAEGQVLSADLEAAARDAGVEYYHVPMRPGQLEPGVVARYTRVVEGAEGPVLGFCRTGKRAMILWAVANPRDVEFEQRILAAKTAGFDLSSLRPLISQT